jgi:CPA1 family monovalent cation:H+ antiporter
MNGVQLLLVIIAAITVTGLANRKGLPAPLVVVTVGLAASFIPELPRLELRPEIILGLVLPPLLYSTALDLSFPSFKRNLAPILRLGVGLVVITSFAVGGFAARVVPGLTFGTALVLGAVVAPPDAVTAVAIGRKLGMPKRVMTILTGESLVNDAAALTLFSVAAAAISGTEIVLENPFLYFGYATVVGVLVGRAISSVVRWIRHHLHDSGLETVLGLIVPFAAYLLAEELHASGVLAVVVAGFTLGHTSTEARYTTRLQERQVWRSLDVLLEAFVFAYMGLQLRFVIDDVNGDGEPLGRLFVAALLVLLVVIAIRPVWVFAVFSSRWLIRLLRLLPARIGGTTVAADRATDVDGVGGPGERPSWKHNALISWTGMRGVVTLAAASGIPLTAADGEPFPNRASIQFVAFVVAVGTLMIQGITLPLLVRRLNISTAGEEAAERRERRQAQSISRAASRRAVAELLADPPDGIDPKLLSRIADRLREAQDTRVAYASGPDPDEREAAHNDLTAAIRLLRERMLSAQRVALVEQRDAGSLDDEVLREVLEQLDYEQAASSTGTSLRL